MTDEPIDETNEADTRPALEQILEELKSGFSTNANGPSKTVNGVRVQSLVSDIESRSVHGTITIHASHDGMHGDMWDGFRRFRIDFQDVAHLAEHAPRLRIHFCKLKQEFSARLEQDCAESWRGIVEWCDAGLPVQKETAVFKPLQLKGGRKK